MEAQLEDLVNQSIISYPIGERDDQIIIYGKAPSPRYFEAGDRMEDDRKGTIPDYSYNRVEFYLVGTQSAWIGLPIEAEVDFFPHGSDVIIMAELEPAEKD